MMIRILWVVILFSCTASQAQIIDVPIGEEEYVGFSPSITNNWCPLKRPRIVDSLSGDFNEQASGVYFKPTRLGVQIDTFAIYAEPSDNSDFNCQPRYEARVYTARGVPDTLVRVRPRAQQTSLTADIPGRCYRDTFLYAFENTLSQQATIGSWSLEGLPSSAYDLKVIDSLADVVSSITLPTHTKRSLTFILTLKDGPFWNDTTIKTHLLSSVSSSSDSLFSNPLDLFIKKLRRDQFVTALFSSPTFAVESGDLDSINVQFFSQPYIKQIELKLPYPFSAAVQRAVPDTLTATIFCGPTVRGTFAGKILARWQWTGFGATSKVDSIEVGIGAAVTKLRLSNDTVIWAGRLEQAPSARFSLVNKPSMRFFQLSKPSIFTTSSFGIASDSVRFSIKASQSHFGRYRDDVALVYQIVAKDGRSAKDSVIALLDLDLHANQWIQTSWNSTKHINGISASQRDTVYLVSDNELYRTTDKGNSWQLFQSFESTINQFHVTGKGGVGLFFAGNTGAYVSPNGDRVELAPKTRPQSDGYHSVIDLQAADDDFSVMSVFGSGYMFYNVSDEQGFTFDTIGECRGNGTLSHSRNNKLFTIFSQSDARAPDCGVYFPLDWHKPILAQLDGYYGGDANGLKCMSNGKLSMLYSGEILSLCGKNNRIAAIRHGDLLYLSSKDSAHIPYLGLQRGELRLAALSDSEIYVVTTDGRILRSDLGSSVANVWPARRSTTTLGFFPNPVNDVIFLKNSLESKRLLIRDVVGRIMLDQRESTTEVDVSILARGVYSIEALNNLGQVVGIARFTKQ
jgi:hypothetical protein